MPTTKPRHQVTETPDLARALEIAERRWPGRPRSALITALAEEGARALAREDDERRRARRALVEANAGGVEYSDTHLDDLRQDWPA